MIRDRDRLLNAITDDLDFMVESYESEFALAILIRHLVDLTNNGFLAKLKSIVLCHGTTDIDAEDDRNLVRLWLLSGLGCALFLFFCCSFDLRSCFKDVCDFTFAWNLLLTNHNIVLIVAELALPNLVAIDLSEDTCRVEYCLTLCAEFCIASHELALLLETLHSNLKDVRIELNSISLTILFRWRSGKVRGPELGALGGTTLIVTEIEVAIEIVRVHLVARQVAIHAVLPLLLLWRLDRGRYGGSAAATSSSASSGSLALARARSGA